MIDYMVEAQRPFSAGYFDEEELRALAGRIFDRTIDIEASMKNHWILEGGEPVRHRFAEITAPTLVLHGTDDPLFPLGHGEALAREIPDAKLIPLPGVGHETPPPQTWDVVVPAILQHTSGTDPDARTRELAAESVEDDDATGWFERLYGEVAHGEASVPWDRGVPHFLLTEWASARSLDGKGKRALVVGCGFGRDSEYVARFGFDTVAFDVSTTAVRLARERYPDSDVEYVVADLLEPPPEWRRAFDLVARVSPSSRCPTRRAHRRSPRSPRWWPRAARCS